MTPIVDRATSRRRLLMVAMQQIGAPSLRDFKPAMVVKA